MSSVMFEEGSRGRARASTQWVGGALCVVITCVFLRVWRLATSDNATIALTVINPCTSLKRYVSLCTAQSVSHAQPMRNPQRQCPLCLLCGCVAYAFLQRSMQPILNNRPLNRLMLSCAPCRHRDHTFGCAEDPPHDSRGSREIQEHPGRNRKGAVVDLNVMCCADVDVNGPALSPPSYIIGPSGVLRGLGLRSSTHQTNDFWEPQPYNKGWRKVKSKRIFSLSSLLATGYVTDSNNCALMDG